MVRTLNCNLRKKVWQNHWLTYFSKWTHLLRTWHGLKLILGHTGWDFAEAQRKWVVTESSITLAFWGLVVFSNGKVLLTWCGEMVLTLNCNWQKKDWQNHWLTYFSKWTHLLGTWHGLKLILVHTGREFAEAQQKWVVPESSITLAFWGLVIFSTG